MAQIAKHTGQVIDIANGTVTVKMEVHSACGSCQAHSKCMFSEKDEKTVEVTTADWDTYQAGDTVTVSVSESLGLKAVALAYILPAVVLVATLATTWAISHSEPLAALVPLAATALYYVVLYAMKDRLQRQFSFGIEKNGSR